jgi:hypothetical protein
LLKALKICLLIKDAAFGQKKIGCFGDFGSFSMTGAGFFHLFV